VDPY